MGSWSAGRNPCHRLHYRLVLHRGSMTATRTPDALAYFSEDILERAAEWRNVSGGFRGP